MSRRNLIRSSAGAALLVAAAAAWLAFAPAQLGGSATYAVVYGTSMLPHFHADDLVIVRKAGSYHAGDVACTRTASCTGPCCTGSSPSAAAGS